PAARSDLTTLRVLTTDPELPARQALRVRDANPDGARFVLIRLRDFRLATRRHALAARLKRETAVADVDHGSRDFPASAREKPQLHALEGEAGVAPAVSAAEAFLLPALIKAVVGDFDELRLGAAV